MFTITREQGLDPIDPAGAEDKADAFVPVAPISDIPQNGGRAFTVKGRSILLCGAEGKVFAVENQCSHAQAALEGGRVRGCHIICPVHGVRFDLRDGTPKGDLTRVAIRTYSVVIEDGMVKVAVPD